MQPHLVSSHMISQTQRDKRVSYELYAALFTDKETEAEKLRISVAWSAALTPKWPFLHLRAVLSPIGRVWFFRLRTESTGYSGLLRGYEVSKTKSIKKANKH